jgi:hypothetical protein
LPISVQVTLPAHFWVILTAPEWVNLFTACFQVIDYWVILSAHAGVTSPTGAQMILLLGIWLSITLFTFISISTFI